MASVQKIFLCKTNEGHIVKTLFELLQNNIKNGIYTFNPKGIFMTQTDNNKNILINLVLNNDSFVTFKIKDNLTYSFNNSYIYKMLKSIKKKDNVSLFISQEHILDLGIEIVPKEQSRTTTSYIKLQNIQPYKIELPNNYGKPVLIPSGEYQKMIKDMNNMSNIVRIVNKGTQIKFICSNDAVYTREVLFGEKDDDGNPEQFEQLFDTETLVRISKISGLSTVLQIYQKKDEPLYIRSNVGSLGHIGIYIKDKNQIEQEAIMNNENE